MTDTVGKKVVVKSTKMKMLAQNESDDDSESEFESDDYDDDTGSEEGDDSEDEEDLSSEDDSVNSTDDEDQKDVEKRTSTKVILKRKGKPQKGNGKSVTMEKGTKAAGTDSGVCSEKDLSSEDEEMESDGGGSDKEKDNLDSTEEGKEENDVKNVDESMFVTNLFINSQWNILNLNVVWEIYIYAHNIIPTVAFSLCFFCNGTSKTMYI